MDDNAQKVAELERQRDEVLALCEAAASLKLEWKPESDGIPLEWWTLDPTAIHAIYGGR